MTVYFSKVMFLHKMCCSFTKIMFLHLFFQYYTIHDFLVSCYMSSYMGTIKLFSEAISYEMKILVSRLGYLPMSSWSGRPLRSSKQAIVTTVGCPPELDDKMLLLKKLHALFGWCREINLEMSWKLFPYWFAFKIPEGSVQAFGVGWGWGWVMSHLTHLWTCML